MNKKGFTIIELLVVIIILSILGSIGIINYSKSLVDARNTKRVSDLFNLDLTLKNTKLNNGKYIFPENSIEIEKGSGNIISYQGFITMNSPLLGIEKIPKDPFYTNSNYIYSTTFDREKFQLGSVFETGSYDFNDYGLESYIIGDFKTASITQIPSIIFSTNQNIDILSDNLKFVIDKYPLNLPYLENNETYSSTSNFEQISDYFVNVPKFNGASSCEEIQELGFFNGDGVYQITKSQGLNPEIICGQCDGINPYANEQIFNGKICY